MPPRCCDLPQVARSRGRMGSYVGFLSPRTLQAPRKGGSIRRFSGGLGVVFVESLVDVVIAGRPDRDEDPGRSHV